MKLLKNLKSRQGVYPIFSKKRRCVKRARNLLLMTLFMTVLRNYNGRLPSFLSTEIKGSFSYDVLKLRDFFTNGILNEYCTKIVLSANKKPSCSTWDHPHISCNKYMIQMIWILMSQFAFHFRFDKYIAQYNLNIP